MCNVLMIAPNCFPVTGAEEIVNIKLIQALSQDPNITIDLISRKKYAYNYPSSDIKEYNVNIRNLKVVSVDNKFNIKTLFQHIVSFLKFGIIYKGIHWAYPALIEAEELIKQNRYDFVLTKNNPSYLVGYYLQKKYGIKWVATWNDPSPSIKYPAPYGKGADYKLNSTGEQRISIMNKADVHIFPSDRLKNHMEKYMSIDSKKRIIIPHTVLYSHIHTKPITNTLNFIHSGNLGTPRNPYTFLAAMRKVIDNNTGVNIKLTILGKSNSSLDEIVSKFNLHNHVEYKEPVEYQKSIEILSDFDVAVIIEAPCEEGIFLPTKVSDFMQAGIPIMAISPSIGVLNDLYQTKHIPYFASVNDIDGIESELLKICNDALNGRLRSNTIPDSYNSSSIIASYKDI